MKSIFCLLTIALLSLTSLMAKAEQEGHGGDADEVIFRAVAESLVKYLETPQGKSNFPEVGVEQFRQSLDEIKVSVIEEDLVDESGNKRTAINQPEKKLILVDRREWTPIKERARVVVPLIFHEYLGILNVERGHYRVSSRIADRSLELMAGALEATNNIFFFSAKYLKRPIALFLSSIQYDIDGALRSGVVARPQRVVTENTRFEIFEGDEIWIYKTSDEPISIHWQGDTRNRHMFIRQNSASEWMGIRTYDTKYYGGMDFTDDMSFGSHFSFFLPTTDPVRWTLSVAGFPVVGVPTTYGPNDVGFYIEGDSERHFGQWQTDQGDYRIYSVQILKNGSQEIWTRSQEKQIQLRPQGSESKLKFQAITLTIAPNGEVQKGYFGENSFVEINNVRFEIKHDAEFVDGNARVSRLNISKVVDPTYSGVPVLYSDAAAEKLCNSYHIAYAYIDKNSDQLTSSKPISFTGEKSFYDAEKDDFVTLKATTVYILAKLTCTPYSQSETGDVPISQIIQP